MGDQRAVAEYNLGFSPYLVFVHVGEEDKEWPWA